MNKRIFLSAIIFIIITLVGCSNSTTTSNKEAIPDDVHKDLLYFVSTSAQNSVSDLELTGELYIKQFEKEEPEKVDSNVQISQFTYEKDLNKVFYITNDHTLYEYEIGKEKKKLAEDVNHFLLGNEDVPILYSTNNFDLYMIKNNEEKEKIGSNIHHVELQGQDVYYVNENGSFLVYNIEERTEKEIASEVEQFKFLNDELDIAYVNEDGFLYYRNAKDGENIRISSDTVYYFGQVHFDGKELFYISGNEDLYSAEVSGDSSPRKIASNVIEFIYDDDKLYYLNTDDNLFKIGIKDDDSTRVASDVLQYRIIGEEIVYLSNEHNLYKVNKELESERVASGVEQFDVASDGNIVYVNDDKAIYVNDKKITDEFAMYAFVYGNVIYSTKDNKIVLLENLTDEHVISDDASKYDFAYYYDNLIYKNRIDFSDIAGIWVGEDEERTILEFSSDGQLKYRFPFEGSVKLIMNEEESAPRSIYAYSDEADGYLNIRKVSENEIEISEYGGEYITYTKTNEEEINKQIAKVQEAEDHEEITFLMNGYINNFADAVNFGNFYYIEDYLAPGSNIYKEQETFIENAYEKDIIEELIDYDILNIQRVDENTYAVTTSETFMIWVDGDSKTNSYENKYSVKRINGEFLLTDIEVKVK